MRRFLRPWILLAGCASTPPAAVLEELLAATPIDVPQLEEELRIEADWIRVIPPALPAVSFAPTDGPWVVVNQGPRPLWLHAASILFEVDFEPFVPDDLLFGGAGRLGGRRSLIEPPPPRPTLVASEWTRLQPGERKEFRANLQRPVEEWFAGKLSKPTDVRDRLPGTYLTRFTLLRGGDRLCRQARDFNAGKRLPAGAGSAPIHTQRLEQFVLPRLDTPGSPWHGEHPIDLKQIDGRRLVFESLRDIRNAGLVLDAFILRGSQELVFKGALDVESLEDRPEGERTRTRIVYRLPPALGPGAYRLLARTSNAARFFLEGIHKCDAPDGAAGRWIEIRIAE